MACAVITAQKMVEGGTAQLANQPTLGLFFLRVCNYSQSIERSVLRSNYPIPCGCLNFLCLLFRSMSSQPLQRFWRTTETPHAGQRSWRCLLLSANVTLLMSKWQHLRNTGHIRLLLDCWSVLQRGSLDAESASESVTQLKAACGEALTSMEDQLAAATQALHSIQQNNKSFDWNFLPDWTARTMRGHGTQS